MPRVPFTPTGFPFQVGLNHAGTETFDWAQLVHAAVTVGRRNWPDVFRHGSFSVLELLWRVAMLRANVSENHLSRLVRSSAYERLDTTEKGSVSFFLGNCMAKAFGERLFGVPWLLHLSVYESSLDVVYLENRDDRPDFVGFDAAGRAIVMEAKGRTRGAPADLLTKAKAQTAAISTIGGVAPTARVAVVSYFSERGLRVHVTDPDGPRPDAVAIDLSPERLARLYYEPLFDFIRSIRPMQDLRSAATEGVELPNLDAIVRIAEDVAAWFIDSLQTFENVRATRTPSTLGLATYSERVDQFGTPRQKARREPVKSRARATATDNRTFEGLDGITVVLGESWSNERMRRE